MKPDMRLSTVSPPILAIFLSACSGVAESDGAEFVFGTGGENASPNSGDPGDVTTTPSPVTPTPVDSCTMMCEIEETTMVPVEGGASCSADPYVAGQGYPGGSTVSFEGAEYTSNYWTDVSPATSSGMEAGAAWSAASPCSGSGTTMEEVTVTKTVCCDAPTEPEPGTGPEPDPTPNPDACALDSLLGESGFNSMFAARRDPFYTYQNLCTALERFPGFAASGDESQDKRELAAFFANVARETGELDYIEQFPESRGNTGNYYGRGPIQLTWDYNYQAAGDAIGYNLLGNPDLVATDGVVTWLTALWFWMDADGAGKGTCHGAIAQGNFGQTINIINGGLECHAGNQAALQRIEYYKSYSQTLGVEPGNQLTCW